MRVESLCQVTQRGKDFYFGRRISTLAISKQRKAELVAQYSDWLDHSQAMFLTEYLGLTMKDIDAMRARVREIGGEFHIIKNTLYKVAFDSAGIPVPDELLQGSTAVAFAFHDAPTIAKAVSELARTSEFVKIKGGFLERRLISAEEVTALAELPPLPVVRSQLLGTLLAPASKLVRTLAEPARQVASVLRAYAEVDASPEPA
jgi:large subunit ribosomal protein L10